MRILILGSTYLTQKCVEQFDCTDHTLVGYVPCNKPNFPGRIDLPLVDESVPHDIKVSIQYDKKVTDIENAYNLHTGLLPMFGGCDILYHTIRLGEKQQGLTFHKMGPRFDEGQVISTITYPVQEGDTAADLYERMVAIAPSFLCSSLKLLPLVTVDELPVLPPRLFKRGDITDEETYQRDYHDIWNIVKS